MASLTAQEMMCLPVDDTHGRGGGGSAAGGGNEREDTKKEESISVNCSSQTQVIRGQLMSTVDV